MCGGTLQRLKYLTQKVICHFIGYPKKSKGYLLYCLNIYTNFTETRHVVFLEDEMVRGRMVAREIDLKEKRVYVPTPMIQEPFFSTCECCTYDACIAVPIPIVNPPVATMDDNV